MSAKEYFAHNVIIDLTSATDFEKRTVLQGECSEWLLERQYRSTASNFGKILYRKQRLSDSMLKNLFTSRDLSNVKAIAHGKSEEKVARTIYSKEMQRDNSNFSVFDADLTVNLAFLYLGAIPDGKVFYFSAEIPYRLLELKCPFSKKDDTLGR